MNQCKTGILSYTDNTDWWQITTRKWHKVKKRKKYKKINFNKSSQKNHQIIINVIKIRYVVSKKQVNGDSYDKAICPSCDLCRTEWRLF